MNFFALQDQARSNTRKLVFLFGAAVLTLVLITSALVVGLMFYAEQQEMGLTTDFLTSTIFLQVSLVVIAVVGLGTLYRLGQLRGGGKTVAEAMGGRLLNTITRDTDERKILNVVEEMAIASGTPVPQVYLMEEESINAFAAGYRPRDAVIGITRGCIRELSRDELQGVVAHEFSHIFNGDMRLNIRLIGLLYGIMVIGLIGYHMLRGGRYSGSSRSGKKGGGGILMLGLGLMVVGYGGTFFGNMIKSAVSRQREYLADATAVQFTRNPEGIGGALKKIGGYTAGTEITSKDASEISHMLFCNGIKAGFTSLFATHPPLSDRIARIDPQWKGGETNLHANAKEIETDAGVSHFANTGSEQSSYQNAEGLHGTQGASALENIGNPGVDNFSQAAATISGFSATVMEDAHNIMSASQIIYSLMMALSDAQTSDRQMQILREKLEDNDYRALEKIREEVSSVARANYLTLVDLCMPSLKQLSPVQYRDFMSQISLLIMADKEISLFEWCLFKILRYTLDDRPDRRMKSFALKTLYKECEVLLSVLAFAGHSNEQEAEAAFMTAKEYLELNMSMQFQHNLGANTGKLEKALDKLNNLRPLEKPKLLKAMVACINADGQVTVEESELLRAVGSLLDCPIPPLLPEQRFI
ncbi:MAG: M48 family metallopeptidase [Gammaproteobacteria bacterium]|nr:M48 family metallopeptidase [Gammaproteobacteria bacterium]